MLDRAEHGIAFSMSSIMKVYSTISSLSIEKEGFVQFLKFLYLLYELSISEESRVLASSSFAKAGKPEESRRVQKVKEYIEAEIRHNHLEDYISQVLIPTEKVYTIRNGKKISKEKVSYPGYVLVEAAFVGQIPIIIRNTPNVLGFLGDTKEDSRQMKATPLRPQEVSRILGRVDELSTQEEENEVPFVVGETVKVTDGPFSSFQGTIETVDDERKKLTVSVKIFGRKTPMELSFTQVEKE
jgi:transcriptional antiterminator NusG